MNKPYLSIFKSVFILLLALSLSACASGANVAPMTVGGTPELMASTQTPAKSAIALGKVDGGSDTYALWKSNVSTENFRLALKNSLENNAFLAQDQGRYKLDATLTNLDQPVLGGFDMTVTAYVQYRIEELSTNKVMFNETIVTPYTANFSDSFLAVERLRLANEGAIRENIRELIKKVSATLGLGK
jgi:hypothetical protein